MQKEGQRLLLSPSEVFLKTTQEIVVLWPCVTLTNTIVEATNACSHMENPNSMCGTASYMDTDDPYCAEFLAMAASCTSSGPMIWSDRSSESPGSAHP